MIKSIWKPRFNKKKLIHYELVDENITCKKPGISNFKVIWVCDNQNCKYPNKIHSISACHLKKEKMSFQTQICRPCQCTGEGNGRFGDHRKWEDFLETEKLNKLKDFFSKKWIGDNNPSKKNEVKIKKNQPIIDEFFLKKIVEDKNFNLVEIVKINGKNSLMKVKCNNNHLLIKKYLNFSRKNNKYICEKCYYDSLKLSLTDEEIKKIENYKKQVRSLTTKNYKLHKESINPNQLKIGRGFYHIDHKFSIFEGFKNNVPPKIISAKENLEVLTESENCRKQDKCSITLDELFSLTKYLL
jgi:hypothetical protein